MLLGGIGGAEAHGAANFGARWWQARPGNLGIDELEDLFLTGGELFHKAFGGKPVNIYSINACADGVSAVHRGSRAQSETGL